MVRPTHQLLCQFQLQTYASKDIRCYSNEFSTFAGKTVKVNGEDKAITIKENSYTLLDNDEVTSTPAYAADGTTEIGTYTFDPTTGQVTFTQTDKSYTWCFVTPAKVQAEAQTVMGGLQLTPEIVPVTPTFSSETEDIQVPLKQVNLNSKVEL